MTLELYDTLTQKKRAFTPRDPHHARVYVCGPTVYDYAHLGHARCYVVYDVLVRHLRASGTRVTYCRNITDIDDKILNRARERDEEPLALSRRFTEAFTQDMTRLGNLVPDVEPKVSEHLEHIHALIQRLIDAGAAYASDGDVYFSVASFPEYGKLSHRKLEDLVAGASGRVSETSERKRSAADFALWKRTDGEGWDSPWGPGRPGWHIECSAMSMAHLGESFDLHGGGLDLVFPHHENELAQAEAATGKPYAMHWMHNGFIEVDKQKMSKSLGNFFTARDLFERVEPEAMRMYCMTVHYRAPMSLEWSLDDAGHVTGFLQIEEAERRLEYLYQTRQRLEAIPEARVSPQGVAAPEAVRDLDARLAKALDDDLNMPQALAVLADFLRHANELCDAAARKKGKVHPDALAAARKGFAALGERLGLGLQDATEIGHRIRARRAAARDVSVQWVQEQIVARRQARTDRDFERADAIRDALLAKGIELLDGTEGTDWRIS